MMSGAFRSLTLAGLRIIAAAFENQNSLTLA